MLSIKEMQENDYPFVSATAHDEISIPVDWVLLSASEYESTHPHPENLTTISEKMFAIDCEMV